MNVRQNHHKLDALPDDIVSVVSALLPLADLHNLRLAGLGSKSPAQHAQLSADERARVRAMQHLFGAMTGADVSTTLVSLLPPGWALERSRAELVAANAAAARVLPVALGRCLTRRAVAHRDRGHAHWPADRLPEHGQFPLSPARLSRCVTTLSVPALTVDLVRAAARDFPRLLSLQLSDARSARVPALHPLPAEMPAALPRAALEAVGGLHGLQSLTLEEHRGLTSLPRATFRGLSQLRILNVHYCASLKRVPDDIGTLCPRLATLVLGAVVLEDFPRSLVDTLLRNFRRDCAIYVAQHVFDAPTWDERLAAERYPEAFERARQRVVTSVAGAESSRPWWLETVLTEF